MNSFPLPPLNAITALKFSTFLCATLLITPAVSAESVVCHVTYGGATHLIEAPASTSPYTVTTNHIGSFFLFRIVFRQAPADLAGIKIYTYAELDSGPALIHQANHAYPPINRPTDGFSGHNLVYEPLSNSELQYWCEFRPGAEK